MKPFPPPEPELAEFLRRYLPGPPVLPKRITYRRRDGHRLTITWRTGLRRYLAPTQL